MNPKVAGLCSKCDAEVYEVRQRDPRTGLPQRLGAPMPNAHRVTFLLMNGSQMDLTFCHDCVTALEPTQFPWLWQRVMVSWAAEHRSEWAKTQLNNGIVGLLGMRPVREAA